MILTFFFLSHQGIWCPEQFGPFDGFHGDQCCAMDLPAGDVAKQVLVVYFSHAENLTHHVYLPGRLVAVSYTHLRAHET